MHDHDLVETPHGTFRALPDTSITVPIHLVLNPGILMPDGHWSREALEDTIGRPNKYVSRTMRLFVAFPKLSFTGLRIRELMDMLHVHAGWYDLSIKLTCYPYKEAGLSKEDYFNVRPYDEDQLRLSIDVFHSEIIRHLSVGGKHAGRRLLEGMHIVPDNGYTPQPGTLDIKGLAQNAKLEFARNTEYDFNTLVVDDIVDGKVTRKPYPLRNPSYQPA